MTKTLYLDLNSIFSSAYEISTFLQLRKLRLRKVESLAHGWGVRQEVCTFEPNVANLARFCLQKRGAAVNVIQC